MRIASVTLSRYIAPLPVLLARGGLATLGECGVL